jgi:hypothetical protein
VAISLTELRERRDALFLARVSGTLVCTFPDKSSVTYKSDADMASALRALDDAIAAAEALEAGTPQTPRRLILSPRDGVTC